MRWALLLVLLLLPTTASAAPVQEPQVLWFEGRLECGAGAAGQGTGRVCGSSNGSPPNFHKFVLPRGTHLAVVEFDWLSGPLIGEAVRLEMDSHEPERWQRSLERVPVLQWRVVNPSDEQAGSWSLWVMPAIDSDRPNGHLRAGYQIAVSLFPQGVRPDGAYSAMKGRMDVLTEGGPTPVTGRGGVLTLVERPPTPEDAMQTALFLTLSVPFLALAAWRWWPLLSLFTRVERDRALLHPRRQALYDLVAASAGIRPEALRERAELPNGVFRFHLQILLRLGLLRQTRIEGVRHLYVNGAPPPSAADANARWGIVSMLREQPGSRIVDVARGLALPESNVRYHVRRLAGQGRVVLERSGRDVRCYLRDTATSLQPA